MITCISGLMGSGKTYYSLYNAFEKKEQYGVIFNNVQGLKDIDNFQQIKYHDFFSFISQLEKKKLEWQDEQFINAFIKEGYLVDNKPTLFIIDEAHNFFDKGQSHLIWLLTYHRHFNIDIHLVTQNPSLMNRNYYSIIELFIKAIPQSLTLQKYKFKYQKHCGFPFSDYTKTDTFSIPKKKEIFQLYTSGDKVRIDSFLKKYIYYIIMGIAVILFLVYQIYLIYTPVTPIAKEIPQNSHSVKKNIHNTHNTKKNKVSKKIRLNYDDNLYVYSAYNGYLECKDIERSIPLFLVPKPFLKKILGYGVSHYYYIHELKFCMSDKNKKIQHEPINYTNID